MPEPATPPPAAPPAAPQTPPAPAAPPVAPAAPPPIRLEDDPNHGIAVMIANRGKKKAESQPATPPPAADPAASKPPETPAEPATPSQELGALLHKTLGFRSKPADKAADKAKPAAAAAPAAPAAAATPPADPAQPPSEPAKTIVTRRKEKAAPDIGKVAGEAASAAVREAMRATAPQPGSGAKPPEESLNGEDRHEYEVARHLAATNPKYKGAEQVVIDHVRKAEAYASRWEQQNPGKVFDPNDDDHNTFYESLEKPWSDYEFRMAENEIAAQRVAERSKGDSEAKIREIQAEQAHLDLTPAVNAKYNQVAGEIAKAAGQDVYDTISKKGFDQLDVVTQEALAEVVVPLQPLIETIVVLDDPKGRVRLNPSDPRHQEWTAFVLEKEQLHDGNVDSYGRTFATREAFARMNDAQRRKHYYLTTDHLLAELAADASEAAKASIASKRDKAKKYAAALGYTASGASTPPAALSQTTNGERSSGDHPPATSTKPVSPAGGGSPKIDSPADSSKTGAAKVLERTSQILFGR